jgi:hypothetical protein
MVFIPNMVVVVVVKGIYDFVGSGLRCRPLARVSNLHAPIFLLTIIFCLILA